jgi:zinc protease
LIILTICGSAVAQAAREPYQERLLNGLKVLVWNDPNDSKVMLKLRIHSGSAFDSRDKMGTMALLSDILFPDPQTRAYFEEDLEGKLEITSNYDYIQITAYGKADEFINILDTLRTGVVVTPINQENFVKVRDARLAKIKEETANPAIVADWVVARQLLGDYPYGRPMNGTPESLAKIDRFDMVTAKDKFLDADNATLSISGKIDPKYAVGAGPGDLCPA